MELSNLIFHLSPLTVLFFPQGIDIDASALVHSYCKDTILQCPTIHKATINGETRIVSKLAV